MSDKRTDGYDVGYGKPPKPTQFKKGHSGNPKGRPKGKLNAARVLERALKERVVINENGRRKVVTKLEASVKQLVNHAASGDWAAWRLLIALEGSGERRASDAEGEQGPFDEADEKVMSQILDRLKKGTEEQLK